MTAKNWKVEPLMQNWHGYKNWNTFTIRDSKTNVCLATVGEVDRYFQDEYKDIAALIAAAPDLLEMLEALLDTAQAVDAGNKAMYDNPCGFSTELFTAARAAIAKAKGQ